MTSYLNLRFVGEALTQGALDTASVQTYLRDKYTYKPRIPTQQVLNALHAIAQMEPFAREELLQECREMAACDNEPNPRPAQDQARLEHKRAKERQRKANIRATWRKLREG